MAYIEGAGSGATYKPGSYTTYQQTKPKTPVAPVAPKAPTVPKATTTTKSTTSTANASVVAQQQKLKAAGYDPGPIDGINGPMTQAAQAKYNADQAKAKTAAAQPTAAEIAAQKAKTDALIAGVNKNDVAYTGLANSSNIRSNTGGTTYSNLNTNNPSGVQYKYNPQDMIDAINASAKSNIEAQLAQIAAAYAKSRSEINSAIPQLQQQSQAVRDQTTSDYYTQTLPELRAAAEQAGVYRGGDLYKGTNISKAAQMQALGQINQNEQNQLNNLNTNLRDIDYQEGQAQIAAQAGAQADLQDKLLNANQFLANLDLSQQGLDLDKIKQAYYQAVTDAGITGKYNGNLTADEASRQWQQSTDNPSQQAQILSNEITKLQLQYLPQEEQLKLKQIEQDILSGRVDMQQAYAQIQSIKDQNALAQQKFSYEKSQNASQMSQAKINNAISQIDSLYIDKYGGIRNPEAIKAYILSLFPDPNNTGVYDNEIDQLYARYGIK